MSSNVQDLTLEISKNIQASLADLNQRFDRLEARMRKDRRNVAGMLVMMRPTAGDFDQRVSEVEERITVLERRT